MGICINTTAHSIAQSVDMRLFHYTPTVPHSYCVGVHNGHGFGSLFARLFSKVAAKTVAKTAAKTALRVAKSAGRRALKEVTNQAPKILKEVGKTVLEEGSKIGGQYIKNKIDETAKKALNTPLPTSLVHSVTGAATRGIEKFERTVVPKLNTQLNSHIDRATEKIEKAAGIEKKRKRKPHSIVKKNKPKRRKPLSLEEIIQETE